MWIKQQILLVLSMTLIIQNGIKKEWLYDLIDMPYENIVVKVPRKYHEILVYEFGENYMTPPPIEQQVPGGDKNYWIN